MKVDIHFADGRGNVITVLEAVETSDFTIPAGFESDGVSVPRFFWRIISPPIDPRTIRAGVVHDWIYRHQPAGWTRRRADAVFRRILIEDGVERWRAWLAWAGVRIGGGKAWEDSRFRIFAEARQYEHE